MIGDTAVLLVDDDDKNLLALEAILEPTGYRLVKARSGEEALKAVLQDDFAAILLDVQMPGLDGFETAELIRTRERSRSVPIIFVTAISTAPENVFRGYGAGAVDYLFKPVDPVVLRSKVEVFGELSQRGRALAEREELLRATFEDAPIGMARADADGRLHHVNRALTQTLGRAAGELVGRTLDELGPPAEAGRDATQREQLLAGRIEQYESERRLAGPRGTTIPVLVSASLARSNVGGRPDVILHLQDLRERRRAQRDREQLIRAQAARAHAEAAAERLRIMQSIAVAALGAEDLEELLRELLDRILEALDVDRAAVVLTDEARAVVARAAGGVDTVVARESNTHVDDIVTRVRSDPTRPLAIPDIAAAGLDASSLGPAITSLLAVPLADGGGTIIGSIHVGTLTRRDFDDETIALLRLAADRAGLAIARTRLYARERGIATELQRSLLPKVLPVVPGVALGARYLPGVNGTTVGGDWYDAIALPSGRVALAIGDVVGRGIAAAATMGQMRSALRAILMQADNTGLMADRLNRFAHALGPEAMMTTVVLAILEPATGTLRYTNAGHPPPLLVGPDGDARFLSDTPSPPMGVLASPRYPEHTTVLEPGSTFVLYTDGLVEESSEVLDVGLERLLDAGRGAGEDVAATCERLLERGLRGASRADDVTLLVVRTTQTLGAHVKLEVSGEGGGLFAMRQTLRRWLGETEADEDETEDIVMACNEACENSVEHGYGFGDDRFEVHFERAGGEVTIQIRDNGNWRPPQDEPDRGHGLALIGKLMDSVDVQPRPGGTTVVMRRLLAAGAAAARSGGR